MPPPTKTANGAASPSRFPHDANLLKTGAILPPCSRFLRFGTVFDLPKPTVSSLPEHPSRSGLCQGRRPGHGLFGWSGGEAICPRWQGGKSGEVVSHMIQALGGHGARVLDGIGAGNKQPFLPAREAEKNRTQPPPTSTSWWASSASWKGRLAGVQCGLPGDPAQGRRLSPFQRGPPLTFAGQVLPQWV